MTRFASSRRRGVFRRPGQGDGVVVVGVVVLGVVVLGGGDGGGGVSGASAWAGAGSGAGGGGVGSFATARARAALVGGVVMAGAAAGAGAAGGAVVGTGFASGGAGRSVSLSTAVTDPKPTSRAATHASGTKTARLPSLAKNERRPASWSGARDSPSASPCPRSAPSLLWSAVGSVGASLPSVSPPGSVASSMRGTPLGVARRTGTIPQPYSFPKREPQRDVVTLVPGTTEGRGVDGAVTNFTRSPRSLFERDAGFDDRVAQSLYACARAPRPASSEAVRPDVRDAVTGEQGNTSSRKGAQSSGRTEGGGIT